MISDLANHLWQSTIFAIVAGSATLLLKSHHARIRYWLWLAASIKFLIPFSLLVALGAHIDWRSISLPAQSPVPAVLEQIDQPFATTASHYSSPVVISSHTLLAKLIPILWLAGSLLVIASWTGRSRRIRAALRLARPIQLQAPVPVLSSPSLFEPGVFGIFHPVLLLPEGIADRLTPSQLAAVIAHELCHVRRRDNLFSLVHLLVEAAFWFHPLVWVIGARLVDERERACDEEVLQQGNDPQIYAESILNVCKVYLQSPIECVSGISGSDLKQRIERIMTQRLAPRLGLGHKLLLAALGTAALATPLIIGLLNAPASRAQSPPPANKLQFEVASVKLVKNPVPYHMYALNVNHGTVSIDAVPLKTIIAIAYKVQVLHIHGGPGWLDDERYDIVAKTENPNTTKDEARVMLQSLLADRFKLAFHWETRQLPVYNLVVEKNGPKLKEATDDERTWNSNAGGAGWMHITFTKWSMPALVNVLVGLLGEAVLDKTGLDGKYDFKLDYAQDRNRASTAADNPGPSLFTALQEQLGLKLESGKGPVETMMIDYVDHASEN